MHGLEYGPLLLYNYSEEPLDFCMKRRKYILEIFKTVGITALFILRILDITHKIISERTEYFPKETFFLNLPGF